MKNKGEMMSIENKFIFDEKVKHIVVCPENVTLGLGKPDWDIVLWFAPRVVNGKMLNSKLFYDTVATKSEAVKIAKTLHKQMPKAPITIVDKEVANG